MLSRREADALRPPWAPPTPPGARWPTCSRGHPPTIARACAPRPGEPTSPEAAIAQSAPSPGETEKGAFSASAISLLPQTFSFARSCGLSRALRKSSSGLRLRWLPTAGLSKFRKTATESSQTFLRIRGSKWECSMKRQAAQVVSLGDPWNLIVRDLGRVSRSSPEPTARQSRTRGGDCRVEPSPTNQKPRMGSPSN